MNYRRRSARLICVGSYLGNLRNQPYRQLTNHGLPPTTTAGAPRVGGDKDHAGPQRRDDVADGELQRASSARASRAGGTSRGIRGTGRYGILDRDYRVSLT